MLSRCAVEQLVRSATMLRDVKKDATHTNTPSTRIVHGTSTRSTPTDSMPAKVDRSVQFYIMFDQYLK